MFEIINALVPLVSNLTPVFASLFAQLKAQGFDSDAIIQHASQTLDAEKVELLKEQLRLQQEIDNAAN